MDIIDQEPVPVEDEIKIQITHQQYQNVCEARHVMWPSIKPSKVKLDGWHSDCGTFACFGGFCTTWPAFRHQGLDADSAGCPVIGNVFGKLYRGTHVAVPLFGFRELFESRGDCISDQALDDKVSDYDMVTARLDWLLAHCVVVD